MSFPESLLLTFLSSRPATRALASSDTEAHLTDLRDGKHGMVEGEHRDEGVGGGGGGEWKGR